MMNLKRPRILLTGRNGQVGWELERTLSVVGDVFANGHREMDLSDPDRIRSIVRQIKPDIIVNPAAYTSVDEAEREQDLAMAVNGIAPGILAEEARRIGALLVHYSTDYVFDGRKNKPYTEEDETNPLNFYGKSKLAGEKAIKDTWDRHVIFRSSWIYGSRGNNFLRSILKLAHEEEELRVVDDQVGCPTWCRRIAEATAVLLRIYIEGRDPAIDFKGTFHIASPGRSTRYGFAKEAISRFPGKEALMAQLKPVSSDQFSLPAVRPSYSVLDSGRLRSLFGLELPDWRDDLDLVLQEIDHAEG